MYILINCNFVENFYNIKICFEGNNLFLIIINRSDFTMDSLQICIIKYVPTIFCQFKIVLKNPKC